MSSLVFSTILSDPDLVNNLNFSSANTSFPGLNALDLNKRKKTWRSSGCFEITSNNNKLIFRESVGVDLTATLTVGVYSGDAAFFLELKTALEAAGASVYTITRDTTTNRIKITSDLSGGGGLFQLQLTNVLSTLADVIGFDTASNLTGAAFYEADVLRIHTSEWIEWDLGFPSQPTGFIAVADRNKPLKLSPTATIKLQGNWTNTWGTPAFETTLTYHDYLIAYINKDAVGVGYRYWRFLIIDRENPTGYVEFGAVMLGIHATITRGCPVYPFEMQQNERSFVAYSEGGQPIAGRKQPTQRLTMTWKGLDVASKEELELFFFRFGKHTSFFVCTDPHESFTSDKELSCHLLKFESDPTYTLDSHANFSMSWQLREEL